MNGDKLGFVITHTLGMMLADAERELAEMHALQQRKAYLDLAKLAATIRRALEAEAKQAQYDMERKSGECASANERGAESESTEANASADPNASRLTTASESGRFGKSSEQPSTPPSGPTSASTDASTLAAEESACASPDGLAKAQPDGMGEPL